MIFFLRNKSLKKHFPEHVLFILIVLITVLKLNLIGAGFLAFPDELRRYGSSGSALKNLSQFELKSSLRDIFSTEGRPGDAFIELIPNTLQFVTGEILGKDYYESKNSFPLFLFNFLIYACILLLIYRLTNYILKNDFFALFSVLTYTTLTNSHLYLRHAIPYDTSLLILLFVLYRIIVYIDKDKTDFLTIFNLGLLCFFGYLVYPGYILLCLVILITSLLYKIHINQLRTKLLNLIYFSLGSVSCLIIFEMLSRFAGTSYIQSALHLSSTITQGSFDESFVFILKYLVEVEYITGIILIISLPLTLVSAIKIVINKEYSNNSIILLLFLSLTTLYVIYAGAGYFFNKVVLYGRLIHQFFPFLCIFLAFTVSRIFNSYILKKSLVLAISVLGAYNFFIAFDNYLSHSYPRDIAWQYLNAAPSAEIISYCEYENSWSALPKKINKDLYKFENISTSNSKSDKIYIINCCYVYSVNDLSKYNAFNPTSELKLIDSKKHFLNFKAYQYEGYGADERKLLDKLSLNIKVFSK